MFQSVTDSGCIVDGVATIACAGVILHNIVVGFMIATAVVVLFMLIIGSIRYILSGGDKQKVDQAKKTITYAIIGIALVFLSFVILRVVSSITGNNEIIDSNLEVPVPPSDRP